MNHTISHHFVRQNVGFMKLLTFDSPLFNDFNDCTSVQNECCIIFSSNAWLNVFHLSISYFLHQSPVRWLELMIDSYHLCFTIFLTWQSDNMQAENETIGKELQKQLEAAGLLIFWLLGLWIFHGIQCRNSHPVCDCNEPSSWQQLHTDW